MVDREQELYDIVGQIHAETEKAILFSDDGDKNNAQWLPRSQIEIEQRPSGVFKVTMPAWLAKEKEFV